MADRATPMGRRLRRARRRAGPWRSGPARTRSRGAARRARAGGLAHAATPRRAGPRGHAAVREVGMARFRSNKRAKELQRKAKHEAKEARKRERQERSASGEVDDDIDWSQAVGVDPPPGWRPPGSEAAESEEGHAEETDVDEEEDAATTKSAS